MVPNTVDLDLHYIGKYKQRNYLTPADCSRSSTYDKHSKRLSLSQLTLENVIQDSSRLLKWRNIFPWSCLTQTGHLAVTSPIVV